MKKIMALILVVMMLFCLVGCGTEQEKTSSESESQNTVSEYTEDESAKSSSDDYKPAKSYSSKKSNDTFGSTDSYSESDTEKYVDDLNDFMNTVEQGMINEGYDYDNDGVINDQEFEAAMNGD